MKNIIAIFSFLSLLMLTSCNVVNVTTDYDRQANFDTYKTYSFHQKGLEKLDINDLDKRRSGELFTRSAARKQALALTSITAGSGHTPRSLKKRASPLSWVPDSTRVFLRLTVPSH